MGSPEYETSLPRVEEADLLQLVTEEVIDPSHKGWWDDFAEHNPELAREVIRRAFTEARETTHTSPLEIQRRIVNSAAFVVRALENAAKRSRQERLRALISDGGDGEDLQP